MADLEVFGFEKDDIKGNVFEKYKGKKGQTDRCAIVYSDPKALFAGSKIHFKEKYFLCKKGKCCEVLGPSKYRVGAVLIKYSTDRMGNPKKPFGFELFPWVFSEATFVKLKTVNTEFPLAKHDIKITCTNEEYQYLDITPCNESLWTSRDDLKASVLEQAKTIWEQVKRSIAQDLSVEDINNLLGVEVPVGNDPSTKIDLDSVLDKI